MGYVARGLLLRLWGVGALRAVDLVARVDVLGADAATTSLPSPRRPPDAGRRRRTIGVLVVLGARRARAC